MNYRKKTSSTQVNTKMYHSYKAPTNNALYALDAMDAMDALDIFVIGAFAAFAVAFSQYMFGLGS